LEFSAGLVPEPALCPGVGAAERPQEILYCFFFNFIEKSLKTGFSKPRQTKLKITKLF
jgi:hypothetical protein